MAVRMTGMISGMDTESLIQSMLEAQKLKNKKTTDKKTKLEWTQEKWKELNTKLYKLYTDQVSKLSLQGSYGTKKVSCTDESKVKISANSNAPLGSQSLKITQLATAGYLTGAKITTKTGGTVTSSTTLAELGVEDNTDTTIKLSVGDETKEIQVTSKTTVGDFLSSLQSAGVNASLDATNHRIFISSKKSGLADNFSFDETEKNSKKILEKLGIRSDVSNKIDGQDAKFTLNGADFTSASNEATVNGITLTLTGTTTDTEEIHFTVTNDTDAVYNMIKEFVTEYNSILEEMNTLYYADSSRGYDPLSDDEREAMSETDIEKWETKIKDSLLRRDTTLGSLLTSMRSILQQTVTVDGKSYSISNFGVSTSSAYTEKGKLHIYGDADDDTYSDEENDLKAALESDPDTVMQVFSGVMKEFSSVMKDKMKKIDNASSALTFYNDITLKNQLIDLNKQIAKEEDKLIDIEDKYYKQFAAMETALSKLQSQESAIAGFFNSY